jgi:hypothetical protein
MQIIRLKFTDASEAETPLASYREDERCTVVATYPTEDTGALDEEGVPLLSPVAGHHIDILARATVDLSPLAEWVVTPVTPQHGFAGVAE